MDVMSFPTLPGKHGYPSAYPPGAFLDALRGSGWEPGTVPGSVIFTYARFELFLSAHPETYTPNHMLGRGHRRRARPGRDGLPPRCRPRGRGAPAAVRHDHRVPRRGSSMIVDSYLLLATWRRFVSTIMARG